MLRSIVAGSCIGLSLYANGQSVAGEKNRLDTIVSRTVRPLMEHEDIPGMAVGIVCAGQSSLSYYGTASRASGRTVDDATLFEIGSVSKTFTATLASFAQANGRLSLADPASKYLPVLRGSHFDEVNVLELGTHTPGGLPLQVPDEITNDEQLMRYFRRWQPAFTPGTYRTYSNPGIGLLGRVAATSLQEEFNALMEGKLYPALGLRNTYLHVPASRRDDYAQGDTSGNAPIRMAPGVLDSETYGVRTTAGDLLRFVEANMGMLPLDPKWQRAITDTHTGYYQVSGMTQDLVWEQYPYPVELGTLLAGNSDDVILKPNPVRKLDPPLPPQETVLINKTGSTNGFSTYVAFVPARKLGIVLLANKRYPIAARVRAAYEILVQAEAPAAVP
jgi:beta-lactamase class C